MGFSPTSSLKAEIWVEAVTEGGRRGGSWLRGGKKRKTRPDIARRRERGNETRKVAIAHGSVEFCEATPIGLVDES